MMISSNRILNKVKSYLLYLWQHRSIYKLNVVNDFKGRFKYTLLGYFWHLLNPLTQIIIYYVIFTVIFGRDIPDYWVYLSTGMFAFSFFLFCSSGAANTIVSKKNIITKMPIAKEILVFSRVTIGLISLSISYCILALLIGIFTDRLTINVLYVPVIVLLLAIFNTGIALILSAVTVYVRDIANVVSLLIGCMMFALPIMYMAETRSTPAMDFFWSINPLYYFIESIHNVLYLGISPNYTFLLICFICAVVYFFIGLIVFKKLENGFVERL